MTRITGTLHEDLFAFMTISCWIILRIRTVSDRSCRENQNTHVTFNNAVPKSHCLWDNVEKFGGDGEAEDDDKASAHWVSGKGRYTRARVRIHSNARLHKRTRAHKYTHTHPCARLHTQKCVILISFSRQQWFREYPSVLSYTYTDSLVRLLDFLEWYLKCALK